MSDSYWNNELSDNIICPYCGKEYTPSYEDTFIGDEIAECYTEETNVYTCDNCGKKFKLTPCLVWKYQTETIDGEMTEEEHEKGKKTDNLPSCNSCIHYGEWSSTGNCIKCRGFDRYEREDNK